MEQYPVRKIEKPIDWCVTVPGKRRKRKNSEKRSRD